VHDVLAMLAQSETLRLAPDQAKQLASALHDVGKHYRLPVVSPEKLALGVLIYTAGRVYVPMGVAFWQETRQGGPQPIARPVAAPQPGAAPSGPATPAAPWFDPAALAPNVVN